MIEIGTKDLTLEDVRAVVMGGAAVSLPQSVIDRADQGLALLRELSTDRVIYGVNTGFGPMAAYAVSTERSRELQYNLIRSHALGTGAPLSAELARPIVLARLSSLAAGQSGVGPELLQFLAGLLNSGVMPLIPEHGGVGASGDLVQLAHLALLTIGEGEAYHNGGRIAAFDALKAAGIAPSPILLREGLAMVNGTSAMTGIGLMCYFHMENLLHWSLLAGCLLQEIVEAYEDSYSSELNAVKRHGGQQRVAALMRAVLDGSKRPRLREHHLKSPVEGEPRYAEKVQDVYSIRCLPQILGPALESLMRAGDVLIGEFNSVSDNPVLDLQKREIYHGGNFHGEYVAEEVDRLKISAAKVSMLLERQLNFLLNDRINQQFEPFLNLGTKGINLGLQGMQFTATSTTAENQSLGFPASLHSIPSNKDNQDIVSMGSNAALLLWRVIGNAEEVLGMTMVAVAQAVDALDIAEVIAPTTRKAYDLVRSEVSVVREDSLTSGALAGLIERLREMPARELSPSSFELLSPSQNE